MIAGDGEVDEVELAEVADLEGRFVDRWRRESSPSRPASHSSVVPWTTVETTTTKKTALKIVSFCATSEEST